MSEPVTISRTPLEVRWNAGRLQQKWALVRYRDGRAVGVSHVWLDVPTEGVQEPGPHVIEPIPQPLPLSG